MGKILSVIFLIGFILFCSGSFIVFCFCVRCKKTITIISEIEPVKITLFDGAQHCIFALNNGSKIENNISEYKFGINVYIQTENQNVLYSLSEPDHWFPTKHEVKFVVSSASVDEDYGGLRGRKTINRIITIIQIIIS